jgi:hypothetical protein
MQNVNRKYNKRLGGYYRPIFITKITKSGTDEFVTDHPSIKSALDFLKRRYPYMRMICMEHVYYDSPYGSSRIVFQTDIGSSEYFCIWKG